MSDITTEMQELKKEIEEVSTMLALVKRKLQLKESLIEGLILEPADFWNYQKANDMPVPSATWAQWADWACRHANRAIRERVEKEK